MRTNQIHRSTFKHWLLVCMLAALTCLTFVTVTAEARTKSGKCLRCNKSCYGNSCYCKEHDPEYKRTHVKCYVESCNSYTADGCGSYCSYHYNQKFGKKASGSKASTSTKTTAATKAAASTKQTKSDPYDVYDYDDPDDFADEWAEEFGDGSFEDGYEDACDYWEDAH